MKGLLLTTALAISFCLTSAARAQLKPSSLPSALAPATPENTEIPVPVRPFQMLMPTGCLTGDWNGERTALQQMGITPTLTLVTDVATNPKGGRSEGITEASNLGFGLLINFEKMANVDGASFLLTLSDRFGNSLSADYIGNDFSTQQVFGGETFRVVDAAYQQKLFDTRLQFRVGRIAAGDDFLVSTYDYLFMQNGFDGNPVSIFFDSPGMTAYPNAAWGAVVKLRPTPRTYLSVGAYDGDSSIRTNLHHGVDLSLNGPVFVIGEAGLRINGEAGDKGLCGNYKVGFWFDNSTAAEFGSTHLQRGSSGAYGLFDQVLIPFGEPQNSRGFGAFGSMLFSNDPSVAQLPFFFTAGLAAVGLFPSRPSDSIGLGMVYGAFSNDLQDAEELAQRFDRSKVIQRKEIVLELTYRISLIRNSVFFQPDLQYIVNPGGSTRYRDALVLGCQLGLNF